MGADGVLIGTRVLVAAEVWSHADVKQQVVNAGAADSTLVMTSFRNTSRIINNETARAIKALEADGVTDFERYWPYVKGTNTRDAYETGDWNSAMISMGQAAVFADKVEPMEDFFDGLIDRASAALDRLAAVRVGTGRAAAE
jgi:nitronate monooxygenase